jgi:hypothetical protein
VTFLVGPLLSGPVLGVELEWDGAECRPGKYPSLQSRREGDGGAVAWRLPGAPGGRTWRHDRDVEFCRRVGGT